MNLGANSCLARGAGLLSRRKSVIAWMYLGYLALGIAAMSAARAPLGNILNHSLRSENLANGFDLIALGELLARPEMVLSGAFIGSIFAILTLGVILLVCMPGIMGEFLSTEKLGSEAFFHTCGLYLWRFVRLVLLSLVIFLPVLGILSGARAGLVDMADKSWHVRLPFIVYILCSIVIHFTGLVLRAWFDAAEFELLYCNHTKARRALGDARRLTRGSRIRLLWVYLVPVLLTWAAVALLVALWHALPPASAGAAFLVSQLIILTFVCGRLWQRASLAIWFKAQMPAMEVPLPEPSPVMPPDMPTPEVGLP